MHDDGILKLHGFEAGMIMQTYRRSEGHKGKQQQARLLEYKEPKEFWEPPSWSGETTALGDQWIVFGEVKLGDVVVAVDGAPMPLVLRHVESKSAFEYVGYAAQDRGAFANGRFHEYYVRNCIYALRQLSHPSLREFIVV